MYRIRKSVLEVLLVHPGGPFWAKKDAGAWSIPKGEFAAGEAPADAARREFVEETGQPLDGTLVPLTPVSQSRKLVHPFAVEGDLDPAAIASNGFTLEWPPNSGHAQTFPEIDRAAWFTLGEARMKIVAGQRAMLDELVTRVGVGRVIPGSVSER